MEPHAESGSGASAGLTQEGVDALYAALYGELKQSARRERRRVGAGETFATTALVNEAYLKLMNSDQWRDRRHFLATAATAMRQVLVDEARSRLAAKRGAGDRGVPLDEAGEISDPTQSKDASLVALDDALTELAALSPRLAQVTECRYFAGYTDAETAEVLNVNERTVQRDWQKARAWLYDALRADGS